MGFSSQEYWSGLSCLPPEDLPNPGIKPVSLMSPALADRLFTTRATWEAYTRVHTHTHTHWLALAKLQYKTDLCFISSFSTIFPPTILCLSNWVLQMNLFFGHTTWFAGSHLQYSA